MDYVDLIIKNAYKHHRLRVKSAKAVIDNSPPVLHVDNFARFSKMREDIENLNALNRQNTRLLVALNKIFRTKGKIDTFRSGESCVTQAYSKLHDKHLLLQKIDIENLKIGKNILSAKAGLDTWLHDRYKRRTTKKKPHLLPVCKLVLHRFSYVKIPQDPLQLQKLFRPKIWFNLEVKDIRPLGTIVVELYTEAAPQVVLEFIRLSLTKQEERIQFIRLFPHLWLEGNILLNDKTLMENKIVYDKYSIDHGQYTGVLSFNKKHVLCPQKSILNFSISLRPLGVCNGHRVGFGRVCQGFRVLKSIEDFGNKNGKLHKELVVSDCGIFK